MTDFPTPATGRTPPAALLGWLGFVVLVLWTIVIGGSGHGIYLVLLRTISLGLIAVVAKQDVEQALSVLNARDVQATEVGRVEQGQGEATVVIEP